MSKKSFYCWYLGFTEAYGLQGQNRVYEVIQNILKYHQYDKVNKNRQGEIVQNNIVSPSKVTLALMDTGITIIDNTVVGHKKIFKKSNQQIVSKSYSITYDNITYVCRLTNQPYSDIVTFITKSNSNADKVQLYLHAFRFDSDETAIKMEHYLTDYLKIFSTRVEKAQVKAKKRFSTRETPQRAESPSQIAHLYNSNLKNSFLNRQATAQRMTTLDNSSGGGTNSSSSNDLLNSTNDSSNNGNFNYSMPSPMFAASPVQQTSRPTSPLYMQNKQGIDFQSITKEINFKLNSHEPILYPPKDYTVEDRLRGDLEEAKNRRSQNPSIVGHNLIDGKTTQVDEAVLNEIHEDSDFTSASFNEQANQVLKLLDDVVDSEINASDYELNTNIFEFKPPVVHSEFITETKVQEQNVAYRSASFRSSQNNFSNFKNYPNVSMSMQDLYNHNSNQQQNASNKNKHHQNLNQSHRSTSVATGLNDPYYNLNNIQNGLVKTNPLHIIEEESFYNNNLLNNSKNNPYRREFANLSNSNSPVNTPGAIHSSDSKKSKSSSSSNLKIFGGQNKSSKKNSFRDSADQISVSSSQPSAANIGVRAGVWPVLSSYQPQWLSTTALDEESTSEFIMPRNQLDKHTSFKDSNNNNLKNQTKLKYSESAKVNREYTPPQVIAKSYEPTSHITKGISFLKKDCPE